MSVNMDNPTVVRILDSAAECFGREGYHGTSLRAIAEAAGVSKALIHYHFHSKEHLLMVLQTRLYRLVAKEVRHVTFGERPGLRTAFRALDELATRVAGFAELVPVFAELGVVALRREDLREPTESFYAELIALVETGLHESLGPTVGQLILDPKRLASLLMACLHGIALSNIYRPENTLPQLFTDLKELMQHGVFKTDLEAIEPDISKDASAETIGDDEAAVSPSGSTRPN